MWRKLLLPLASLLLVAWSGWNVYTSQRPTPRPAPPPNPPRSPYPHAVAGVGIVEPRTESSGTATISVGSILPGVVTKVFVRIGQHVAAGEPLFTLDDRQQRAELKVRKANLLAAQAQLAKLDQSPRAEEVPPSEARVRQAQANLLEMKDEADRARDLAAKRAISQEEAVQREQAFHVAEELLALAKAQDALVKAGAWEADKAIARATVEQARAQVEQAEVELERLIVRAPVVGDVLQVNIRPGENVGTQPGQTLMALGDLGAVHVRVSVDESDIARLPLQAAAKALNRGTPQRTFTLRFVRVEPHVVPKKSLTGDNAERVDTRVLQVIYAIEQAHPEVYVGQQLDVFIDGGAAEGTSGDKLARLGS